MEESKIDKSSLLEGDASTEVASVEQTTAKILASQQKMNRRFYCDALDDVDVNSVVEQVIPHVVTLLGFSDFGKSTFVASLYYYLMRKGGIGDYKFYDSDTFSGFERRAYIRNERLNTIKRSLRTKDGEGHFLSLYFEKNNTSFELVLSDRSGETYSKLYVDDEDKVLGDRGLKNSKHLIFFIDASVFIDASKRIIFKNSFNKFSKRLNSAGIFNSNQVIDVIFNKMDMIAGEKTASEDDKIEQQFAEKSKEFIAKLESCIGLNTNRIFYISSLNVDNNPQLIEVFEYLVKCCESEKTFNSRVDWVSELLKF